MFLPAGVFSGIERSVAVPSTKTGALFSSTSVTLIATPMVSVPPLPSETLTATE